MIITIMKVRDYTDNYLKVAFEEAAKNLNRWPNSPTCNRRYAELLAEMQRRQLI